MIETSDSRTWFAQEQKTPSPVKRRPCSPARQGLDMRGTADWAVLRLQTGTAAAAQPRKRKRDTSARGSCTAPGDDAVEARRGKAGRAAATGRRQRAASTTLTAALALLVLAGALDAAANSADTCTQDLFCSFKVEVNKVAGTVVAPSSSDGSTSPPAELLVVQTPANNTVFKVAEAASSQRRAEYVSFHVLYRKQDNATVMFECGPSTRGRPNQGGNLDQNCNAVSEDSNVNSCPSHPLFAGQKCAPGATSRDWLPGSGTSLVGAYLVTVKTTSSAIFDPASSVCFWVKTLTQTGSKRCVYLRAILKPKMDEDPAGLFLRGQVVPSTINRIVAFVGNRKDVPKADVGHDVELEVRAKSMNPESLVVIESANVMTVDVGYAELPGQRWQGSTTCIVGVPGHDCSLWSRTLLYRPSMEERDREYLIRFQAVTKFPNKHEFGAIEYAGVACAGAVGACPNGTDVAATSSRQDLKLVVKEFTPNFRFDVTDLKTVTDSPWLLGDVAPPALYRYTSASDGSTVEGYAGPVTKCHEIPSDGTFRRDHCIDSPHPAYVNCAMKPFSFVAQVKCESNTGDRLPPVCNAVTEATEELDFVVARSHSCDLMDPTGTSCIAGSDSADDAVTLGLKLTDRLFIREVITETGSDSKGNTNSSAGDVGAKEYYAHVSATWTPPLQAVGHIYNVCVQSRSAKSFAERCVLVEVKRCFYCTVRGETLHTIAAKFQTNWMQIWSANHERMGDDLDIDLPAGTTWWKETKNPNDLKPGVLIRLGPVFHSPVDTEVEYLLEEFQTTREALLLSNPNLHPEMTHIKADEEVCILPDICSQDREEWLRPKSKDMLFPVDHPPPDA